MKNLSNNSNRPVASYTVSFDGIDDYIDTGSTFESTFQSDFSISVWFKQDDPSGARALFGERNLTSSLKNFVRSLIFQILSISITP